MKRRYHKCSGLGQLLIAVVCLQLNSASAGSPELISSRSAAFEPPVGGGGDSGSAFVSGDGRFVLFSSAANNLATNASGAALASPGPASMNVFLRDRTNGTTTLVSVNLAGTGAGNADSVCTGLSTNGRYALFESQARDLVPGDTNNVTGVFVRDLIAGTTVRVSTSTNGGPANQDSRDSVMTPDGRYVAFVSAANNLVPNDTNGIADVFVRDLVSGTTTIASPGARSARPLWMVSVSAAPQITPDGRYLVFFSNATNVVAGVTTTNEVYWRDLVAGTTVAVSLGAHDLLTNPIVSYDHAISDDGQFVAFAANWTPPPGAGTNALWRMIFRYSVGSGVLESVCSNPVVGTAPYFQNLDMTPDGRFITYAGEPDTGPGTTTSCVFLWDGLSGTTTLVSADLNGLAVTNAQCQSPIIDASGRFIAFQSTATNLTTNAIVGGEFHLYVRDVLNSTTKLVDVGTNGVGSARSIWDTPALTPDGRFVVFEATDADLVPGDNNRATDVFLRDLATDTTVLISARAPSLPNLAPAGASGLSPVGALVPWYLAGSVDHPQGLPMVGVSEDGRYIAFASDAPDLVANDTNRMRDIFVRDLLLGTNILVSVGTNGMAPASGYSTLPAISADGRYVAFSSTAGSLVTGDTNQLSDVFVRDLVAGTTTLVSVAPDGVTPGNGLSMIRSLSADGRYVLFYSQATNLTTDVLNGGENFFRRDLQLGQTIAITAHSPTFTSRPVLSCAAWMTPDGQVVVFEAYATDGVSLYTYLWSSQSNPPVRLDVDIIPYGKLLCPSPNGHRVAFQTYTNIVIKDLVSKTNVPVGGTYSFDATLNSLRSIPQFTADGRFFVYASTRTNSPLATNDFVRNIYVFDFDARTNELISRSYSTGYAPQRMSDLPAISPDGRFVAFRSFATNIVPGVTNTTGQMYLRDRLSGATTVVAPNATGSGIPNVRSQNAVFSGDSQTLVFRSWASDLVFQDFNQYGDVYSWRLVETTAVPVFSGQMVYAPTSGKSPTLTWLAVFGKTYAVQFKDNLSDPVWQPLNGIVTIVGNRGYATDLAPSPSQRFYRIRAY